jgi:hypothetical protein
MRWSCDGGGKQVEATRGGSALAAETRVGDAIQTESRFGSATTCLRRNRNITEAKEPRMMRKFREKKAGGGVGVLLLPATKCILRPLQCVTEFSSKYDSARGSLRVITVTVTSIIFGSSSC